MLANYNDHSSINMDTFYVTKSTSSTLDVTIGYASLKTSLAGVATLTLNIDLMKRVSLINSLAFPTTP